MSKGIATEPHNIPFLMRLIADRARTLFEARAECPVTSSQARVLMYLKRQEGREVSQRELAQYLGVSHATVCGLVQRLVDKGYVRTEGDRRDGRVRNVYLTDASRRDKERMREMLEELEGQLLKGLSEAELVELTRMLEKIYSNIS